MNQVMLNVISGFYSNVSEISTHLGYYTAYSGNHDETNRLSQNVSTVL